MISAPIEREKEGSIKRIVREDGKSAVTEYEIKEVYENGTALCHIKLHTGRTHQIRVHMSHVVAPLYNDFLYGERVDEEDTYYLCCYKLAFTHPVTKEKVTLKTEKSIDE